MAVTALHAVSTAAAEWVDAHARGSTALSKLPGALSAVLAPAPMELSDEICAVLASAPSARLDAWIARGGRHPGDSFREAESLASVLSVLPAATAACEAAAQCAADALRALLGSLRGMRSDDAECEASECGEAGDAAGQDDLLNGVSTATLLRSYQGRPWGEWLAQCGLLVEQLRREAELKRATCDAVLNAPATADADTEPLTPESCDAMATLWKLQPFVDDELLRALIASAFECGE